jgi:hypothetical protein
MGRAHIVNMVVAACWPTPDVAKQDAIVSHALADVGADGGALELDPDLAVEVRRALSRPVIA